MAASDLVHLGDARPTADGPGNDRARRRLTPSMTVHARTSVDTQG